MNKSTLSECPWVGPVQSILDIIQCHKIMVNVKCFFPRVFRVWHPVRGKKTPRISIFFSTVMYIIVMREKKTLRFEKRLKPQKKSNREKTPFHSIHFWSWVLAKYISSVKCLHT